MPPKERKRNKRGRMKVRKIRTGGLARYKNSRWSASAPVLNPVGVMTGIKLSRTAKLRYVDNYTFTSTLGSLGHYKFRANGCHDPDYTGSGHQPYLWDQCKVFYNHYVVKRSNISVSIISQNTGTPLSCVMGVYLDDDVSSPAFSDFTGYIEAGRGTYAMQNLRSYKPGHVKSAYNAKTFFHLDDVKDNQYRIGAAVTTDPNENAIYNVWFQTLDGTTISAEALVIIDYEIEFSELADIAQS